MLVVERKSSSRVPLDSAVVNPIMEQPRWPEHPGCLVLEEDDALEEAYRHFLIEIGFLDRTAPGRVATRRAYEHFGIPLARRPTPLF